MLPTYDSDLQAPVLVVLAFGLYCLASLVHGVLTFRTVPAEAKLLQKVDTALQHCLCAQHVPDATATCCAGHHGGQGRLES